MPPTSHPAGVLRPWAVRPHLPRYDGPRRGGQYGGGSAVRVFSFALAPVMGHICGFHGFCQLFPPPPIPRECRGPGWPGCVWPGVPGSARAVLALAGLPFPFSPSPAPVARIHIRVCNLGILRFFQNAADGRGTSRQQQRAECHMPGGWPGARPEETPTQTGHSMAVPARRPQRRVHVLLLMEVPGILGNCIEIPPLLENTTGSSSRPPRAMRCPVVWPVDGRPIEKGDGQCHHTNSRLISFSYLRLDLSSMHVDAD